MRKDALGNELNVGDVVCFAPKKTFEGYKLLPKLYQVEGFPDNKEKAVIKTIQIFYTAGSPFHDALFLSQMYKYPKTLPQTIDALTAYAKLQGLELHDYR